MQVIWVFQIASNPTIINAGRKNTLKINSQPDLAASLLNPTPPGLISAIQRIGAAISASMTVTSQDIDCLPNVYSKGHL